MSDKSVKTTWCRTVAVTCAAVVLMLVAVLGSPTQAVGQTELAYDHHSEEEYRMFRGFYYDSFFAVFDMLAGAGMPESLEEFEQSPESLRVELCTALVDLAIFRSIVVRALFHQDFNERETNLLTLRILFDLADVEWSPLDEVTPEDQPVMLSTMDSFKKVQKQNEGRLSARHKYCLANHASAIGLSSSYTLVQNYAAVPLEFQLRAFYESQAPFLRWVVPHLREPESQLTPAHLERLEELESLIRSIEQKYDLPIMAQQ